MALDLDGFNALITTETGIALVFDEGQDVETPTLPYISANLIDEKPYKPFQAQTSFEVVDDVPTKTYAIPTETAMQYGVVYVADQFAEARAMIRKFYNYLHTDKFKLAMKRLDDVSLQVISGIRELKINKGGLFERRLTFDVLFHWTDYYIETNSDAIDSAEVEQVAPEEL